MCVYVGGGGSSLPTDSGATHIPKGLHLSEPKVLVLRGKGRGFEVPICDKTPIKYKDEYAGVCARG